MRELDTITMASRAEQHNKIIAEIGVEIVKADRHGASFANLNDAYFGIYDKLDDVYAVTLQERNKRSELVLRRKLIQVAAMAVKGVLSMQNFMEPK